MTSFLLVWFFGAFGSMLLYQVLFRVLVVPIAARHEMVPASLFLPWHAWTDVQAYRDLLELEGRSTAPYVLLRVLQLASYGCVALFLYTLVRDCGSDPESDYEMIKSMGEQRADDLLGE